MSVDMDEAASPLCLRTRAAWCAEDARHVMLHGMPSEPVDTCKSHVSASIIRIQEDMVRRDIGDPATRVRSHLPPLAPSAPAVHTLPPRSVSSLAIACPTPTELE